MTSSHPTRGRQHNKIYGTHKITEEAREGAADAGGERPSRDGQGNLIDPERKSESLTNDNLATQEGSGLTKFGETNQAKILQEALLEVFNQNESLQSRVRDLESQLAQSKSECDAKDNAIAELAAALDLATNGTIQNALDQM